MFKIAYLSKKITKNGTLKIKLYLEIVAKVCLQYLVNLSALFNFYSP